MKTVFLTLLTVTFLSLGSLYGEELKSSASSDTVKTQINMKNPAEDGFSSFLSEFIDYNISIYIADADTTISGTLKGVFKDSLVINTIFRQNIIIMKSTISYVEIKDKKTK